MNEAAIPALCGKTACQLSRMLSQGETTSVRITEAFLQSIQLQNGQINAYLEVYAEEARAAAAASDERRGLDRPLSALDGVPIALKDNIAVKGHILSCASPMLADFCCPYDSTVTEKIKAAGMPILGRLNMDEFGMGDGSANGAFGAVRNPASLDRTAGGSSGGSAAALAARMAPLTLGSDTGGSVRQPASFCGVVGVRPAYGTVSRYGLSAFASSLDQIGPMAGNVQDAALLMNIIAGHDPRDAASDPALAADFTSQTQSPAASLAGRVLAVPKECLEMKLAEPVRETFVSAMERFAALGAEVIQVSLPALELARPVYYTLSSREAASNLARYDGIRYGYQAGNPADLDALYRETRRQGFGPEVKRRIVLGTALFSGGSQGQLWQQAEQARRAIRRELEGALQTAHAILIPAASAPAHPFGQQASPLDSHLSDLLVIPASLAGLPALAFPCGESPEGLPIGMQLMGARDGLPGLLGMAAAYEAAYPLGKGGANHEA